MLDLKKKKLIKVFLIPQKTTKVPYFNNGITMVVENIFNENRNEIIKHWITIVNGGQTTASIHRAKKI